MSVDFTDVLLRPAARHVCRYRIGPHEVECALMDHPAVSDAAVVSSPDPLRGEVRDVTSVLQW